MQPTAKLWRWLAVVFVASFAALGWLGREIYQAAPPIPNVQASGRTLFTADDIEVGQGVWRSAGGQQLGSVWGHGSYVAPDWSADWLHREAEALRGEIALRDHRKPFDALTSAEKAATLDALKTEMRRNTYDAASNAITVSAERARAIATVAAHYAGVFGDDPAYAQLREKYAMMDDTLPSAESKHRLAAFFFWSSWASSTDRPGATNLSYTSNWPHEPLVGNALTSSAAIWSFVSIVLLIAGIAGMVWWHGRQPEEPDPVAPKSDPLIGIKATPSMRATRKYFFAVIGLILLQIAMGVVTAHYAVEGQGFFGLPLAEVLPYVTSRTIHTQVGIFWIATAWLATGLYIAPLLSGHEPKLQKLGVDVLFWALIALVAGSTATSWIGTLQRAGADWAFWIGNQGLEFTSMGRVWQIVLFIGLMLWLVLMGRALWPALKRPSEQRGLIAMVFLSAVCIGGFYATSLTWGQKTHYALVEYWRWWLVHLWVEGFFEVFATAVVALIFTNLGLVRASLANKAIVAETIVFLFGGILGTLHHLYWTGTPTSVIAVGAVFSALEVVPLALLGFEAYRTYRRIDAAPWVQAYRWPIVCFVSVAFWNVVGAGLLGFAINPPASLYYVQGLNLTPAHGHAALFGVYGMLGIGLMLFALRGLYDRGLHADRWLKPAVWGLNAGLAAMVFISLVPAGLYQAWASFTHGLWFARSPEIVRSPLMETLVWLRVPGDVVFAAGAVLLAVYALALLRGRGSRAVAGREASQLP